ncbi:hypothetical protein [Elstera litoralis]|uniref:hypothetical protein n=1 Tax=Elstera litoralis TaxID=552518 RepID=UPI000695BD57|nr:hypothetical protein [Elstera litoralis]
MSDDQRTPPRFWHDLWRLIAPYWFGDQRWVARGLLGFLVGINLGLVYVNVLFNEWYGRFYNALQELDYPTFKTEILVFGVWRQSILAFKFCAFI